MPRSTRCAELADGQYEKLTRKCDWAGWRAFAAPAPYVMFAMANNLGYDIIVRENPEKLKPGMRERKRRSGNTQSLCAL